MGIVHSFHHLDADAYEKALRFVRMREGIPLSEVRALLAQLGRDEPSRFEAESWAEVESEVLDNDAAGVRWSIVCAASARTSCTIDKAYHRPAGGFGELFARERSLAPVAHLFRDGAVPPECQGAEVMVQVLAPVDVARTSEAMAPWLADAARAKIAALSPTLLGRVFGPRDYADAWREGHLWSHWRALGDVVTAAARAREPLAVTWG